MTREEACRVLMSSLVESWGTNFLPKKEVVSKCESVLVSCVTPGDRWGDVLLDEVFFFFFFFEEGEVLGRDYHFYPFFFNLLLLTRR